MHAFLSLSPQALCICPTRELAIQNLDRTEKMGTFCTGTTYALVVPGQNYSSGIQDQILIGTPGRMADMVRRRKISLDHISCELQHQGAGLCGIANIGARAFV